MGCRFSQRGEDWGIYSFIFPLKTENTGATILDQTNDPFNPLTWLWRWSVLDALEAGARNLATDSYERICPRGKFPPDPHWLQVGLSPESIGVHMTSKLLGVTLVTVVTLDTLLYGSGGEANLPCLWSRDWLSLGAMWVGAGGFRWGRWYLGNWDSQAGRSRVSDFMEG